MTRGSLTAVSITNARAGSVRNSSVRNSHPLDIDFVGAPEFPCFCSDFPRSEILTFCSLPPQRNGGAIFVVTDANLSAVSVSGSIASQVRRWTHPPKNLLGRALPNSTYTAPVFLAERRLAVRRWQCHDLGHGTEQHDSGSGTR